MIVGGRVLTIVGVTPRAAPGLRRVDLGNKDSDYPAALAVSARRRPVAVDAVTKPALALGRGPALA
jgi:hypothetical protein